MMDLAIGPDVAVYQVTFDPALASGRVDFAIQKITDGTNVHDGLDVMWGGVKKVPIRGAYHYQRSNAGWQVQADKFLEVAGAKDFHIYALDVEGAYNFVDDAFFTNTRRIIDYWMSKTTQRVILYTNIGYYKQMRVLGMSDWLETIPLWIAYPNGLPGQPELPPERTTWSIHQYSWTGLASRWGTGARTDENVFNGTFDEMRVWAHVESGPPPIGETMQYKATAINNDTRVRTFHNTLSTSRPLGYYSAGTVFEGDVIWTATAADMVAGQMVGDKWLQTVSPIAGWVPIIHGGKPTCNLVEVVPPPVGTIAKLEILPAAGTVIRELDAAGNVLSTKTV